MVMIPKVTNILGSIGLGKVSDGFNAVTAELTKGAGIVTSKILANTIDDLRSGLERHGGLARTNRFSVFMSTPDSSIINKNLFSVGYGLSNAYIQSFLDDPRDIGILCETITMPASTLNTVDYTLESHTQKMVTGFSNSAFSMTFTVTNDYFIPRLFKSWEQSIINRKTNRIKYKDSYTRDIKVVCVDDNNIPNFVLRILKAFPVAVSEVTYDENEMNAYVRCTVSFEYEDFEEYPVTEIFGDLTEAIGDVLKDVTSLFSSVSSSDAFKLSNVKEGVTSSPLNALSSPIKSGKITSVPLPVLKNPFGSDLVN